MDLPMSVTIVTANAVAADQLSDQDYRDIYTEVRSRMTLRAMIELVGSHYSPGRDPSRARLSPQSSPTAPASVTLPRGRTAAMAVFPRGKPQRLSKTGPVV